MIHSTIGVYANGSFKTNGVLAEDLSDHVQYNLKMCPGRAFFVDGICLNRGYLSEDEASQWVVKIAEMNHKPINCTAPYQ